jgi:hypothetical protein
MELKSSAEILPVVRPKLRMDNAEPRANMLRTDVVAALLVLGPATDNEEPTLT